MDSVTFVAELTRIRVCLLEPVIYSEQDFSKTNGFY